MDIFCTSSIQQYSSEYINQKEKQIKQQGIAIKKQILLKQGFRLLFQKSMIFVALTICLSQVYNFGVNAKDINDRWLDNTQTFLNFTMTGNIELTQNTNLIMDYNEQAYFKLSNYFINLDIVKQSESVFLCICLANDCRKEIPLWDFKRLVELSKKTSGLNGKQTVFDIKTSPIICNVENFYHTATEKQLYLTISSQIATYYKENNHLGIFVRSQSNLSGQYTLNLQQKRSFCHKCQNIVSCNKEELICQCQVGTLGQYCTENSIIFKLGQGSDDQISNSNDVEVQDKVFFQKIQLDPIPPASRFLKSSFRQSTFKSPNSRFLTDEETFIKSISKSNKFIYLKIQQTDQTGSNANQTQSEDNQFYFRFKKNKDDRFKIYIADRFQIYSNYISQNDYVKELIFLPDQTDMYIKAITSQKDSQVSQNTTNNENQLAEDSSIQLYTVQLQYDSTQQQDYQLLIVNECTSNNELCQNEIDIQYSLIDFLNSDEEVESNGQLYLIVFLSLTVTGFVLFCSYVIYTKKRNKRALATQSELNEIKEKQEMQFQKIRNQVDAVDKDSSKIKDLSLKQDFETTTVNQDQTQKSQFQGVESPSANKYYNKHSKYLNVNKNNSGSVNKSGSGSGYNDQFRIPQTSGTRRNSGQDAKSKQLYPTASIFANQKEKKFNKPKLLIDQQQSFANIFQGSNSQSNSQTLKKSNGKQNQKTESKMELVTTANTMNNLIGNINDLTSMNTTARQYQNGYSNNAIYLNNEDQNDQDQSINSRRSSIPSEDSHRLPTMNSNNARPQTHYDLKKEEQESLDDVNKKQKNRESNYNGQFTLNNINHTTNNSNNCTLYQVQSKDELDHPSPSETTIKGNQLIINQCSKNEEQILPKQTTNKTINSTQQSPSFNCSSKKQDANITGLKFQFNEHNTEENNSSQIKENKDEIYTTHIETKIKSKENTDDVEKINHSLSSSSDLYLSQNNDLTCDGNISEMKVIDGNKLQTHRRNILSKQTQEDTMRETQTNKSTSQKQQGEFQSICEQDVSKIVEKKLETQQKENNEDDIEDLEGGVRFTGFMTKDGQEQNFGKNSLGEMFDKIKLETPEIFFQNCPKCQSKQHEFQLKLSKIGPDGVRPHDKYCQVCLMKAELNEVKMADSFQKINS